MPSNSMFRRHFLTSTLAATGLAALPLPALALNESQARALIDRDEMDAEAVARRAMKIAAGICIYTNENITFESIGE